MSDNFVDPLTDTPKKPTHFLSSFFSTWAGSFLLAGGGMSLWRLNLSEVDGFEMLWVCVTVFCLLLVIAIFVGWLQRKSFGRRSNSAVLCGIGFTLVTAVGLHATVPMNDWNQQQSDAKLMDALNKNRGLFEERHEQLVWMISEIDRMGNTWLVSPEQLMVTDTRMNFEEQTTKGEPSLLNSVIHFREDFNDLAKQPADMEHDKSAGSLRFSRRQLLPINDLVSVISENSTPFYELKQVEKFRRPWDKLRFVWVARFVSATGPVVKGPPFDNFSFEPGYVKAQAIGFDLHKKQVLGGFEFAATNKDEIEFFYLKDGYGIGESRTAAYGDLAANLEWAFFQRLKELAPEAIAAVNLEQSPFSATQLEEARQHSARRR